MRFRNVWLLGLVFSFSLPAIARWAQLEDAPAVLKNQKYGIRVNKDGTAEYDREFIVEIKNDEGRTAYGTSAISYNSRTTKVENVRAETRNGPNVIEVAKEFIEDKSVASSAEGFDETRKIAVAYPKVEVGSQLYLRYREVTSEVPFPGYFSTEIGFGADVYENDADIEITSELPLYIDVNDPDKVLKVEYDAENPKSVRVHLLKPVFKRVIDETDSLLAPAQKTWIVVSTSKDWGLLARTVAREYEEVIHSPLPASYAKILEAAAKKTTLVDRVNTITSLLADEVRYLGDWRPRRGGHIPRPLETVAATRFGDCKDYSAALTAILRKLGYPAKIAWVERIKDPSPLPRIAFDASFNHAIVYLKLDGKNYWFDPTNFASYAQGIFSDISGRQALVVDGDNSRLEMIPAGKPEESSRRKEIEIRPDQGNGATLVAKAEFIGRAANYVTGIARVVSKARIDYMLAKAIAEDNIVTFRKIEPYDLTSRVTRDTTFKAAVGVRNILSKTTAGRAYFIPQGDLPKITSLEVDERESDLSIGDPEVSQAVYRLKSAKLIGNSPIGCQIRSPWIDLKRTMTREKGDVVIRDVKTFKSSVIPIADLKSKAFADFQAKVQNCFHEVAIVFR